MAMDFPSFPANGQEFTVGTVTYVYNGTGWVAKSATGDYVQRTGDTMSGHLGLPVGPSAAQAVRKDYVDSADTAIGAGKADKTYVDTQDALSVLRDGSRSMTGDLTISKSNPLLVLEKTASGQASAIRGTVGGLLRWNLQLGTGATETTGNAGSNFDLYRYDDSGALLGGAAVFKIERSTGVTSLPNTTASTSPTTGALTVAGGVGISGAINAADDIFLTKSAGPQINLQAPAGAVENGIYGWKGGLRRWKMVLGDGLVETGSHSGSNFSINSRNDDGTLRATCLHISRATSDVTLGSTTPSTSPTTGALTVAGGVGISGAIQSAGNMIISKASPLVMLNKSASGQANSIVGQTTTFDRWLLRLGNDVAETGSNAGSNFDIWRYTDALALGRALQIERATGNVTIDANTPSTSPTTGALTVAGGVGISGTLRAGGGAIVISGTGAALIVDAVTASTPTINFRVNSVQRFQLLVDSASDVFVLRDADNSHGVQLAQNTTSWASYSDARMAHKQNARTVSGLLAKLDRFRLVEFGEDHREIGVLAQELYEFAPQLVGRGDDSDRIICKVTEPDVWTVKPSEAAFVAIQLCKELHERIQQLEEK
jgi:hypothetical protein